MGIVEDVIPIPAVEETSTDDGEVCLDWKQTVKIIIYLRN